MQVAYAYATTYARTHSVTFLSDNLLNSLREVIRENGLSPEKLTQDREQVACAFVDLRADALDQLEQLPAGQAASGRGQQGQNWMDHVGVEFLFQPLDDLGEDGGYCVAFAREGLDAAVEMFKRAKATQLFQCH